MSLVASYNVGDVHLDNATIKLGRIWGSTEEGWNAWVDVFKLGSKEIADTFSVSAPYVEGENPFIVLYNEVAKLNILTNIIRDVPHGYVKPVEVVLTAPDKADTLGVKPKTTKKKKSGAQFLWELQ